MPEKTFAVFTTKSEFPRRFSLQMNEKMKKNEASSSND